MKPWIVMSILVAAIMAARWLLWAYQEVSEASAHISWLLPSLSRT